MEQEIPADDTERLLLSGRFAQPLSLGLAWALAIGLVLAGLAVLRGGGPEASLAAVLVVLPLVGAVTWWRRGTQLRRVVATRTGLLVAGLTREHFIPYALVEAVREDRLSRLRTITVTLRTPVGGLRRFAFVPPYRRVGLSNSHPVAAAIAGRLEKSREA